MPDDEAVDVVCPVCGEAVTCPWKCEHCGKPRPFNAGDGVGSGAQDGGNA
jgi:hypothetical protein